MNKLKVERVVNATQQEAFDAFTKPELLKEWYAPEGMTTPVAQVDLKVGGNFKVAMENDKGQQHIATGQFKEIDKPNKFVHTWSWQGDEMGDKQTQITVTFEKVEEGKTKVTMEHVGFETEKSAQEHTKGWESAFNKLENNFN